jgi:hypothetical protein
MRSQAAQTCSQSRAQRPQHSRARNTHASRPILATPSPESTKERAKGTNSRREPPSAPEPLTSCAPSLVGIKTGLFWYSPALPAAPGALRPETFKSTKLPKTPPGALTARRGRRWHTLLGQKGRVYRPQQREPAGVGLRALLRRQHEVSADAPSEEGAQRCLEARWRRSTGAASTPCLGRMAT